MKTVYMLNKEQADGTVQLSIVSSSEWYSVVRSNQGLPEDQQRYFIVDSFLDEGDVDRMIMEVSRDEYAAWHREHMHSYRNRKLEESLTFLSLEPILSDHEKNLIFQRFVTFDSRMVECMALDTCLMDELRDRLAGWKPWANDVLDMYLQGKKKSCTAFLAQKYGVSPQVIRKYKRQFEGFVEKFLKDA